jgi:hypothetical protein
MKTIIIINTFLMLFFNCIGQQMQETNFTYYKKDLVSKGYEIIYTASNRYIVFGKLDTTYFSKDDSVFYQFDIIDTKPSELQDNYWLDRKLFCDLSGSFCMFKQIKVKQDSNVLSFINFVEVQLDKNGGKRTCNLTKTRIVFGEKEIQSYNTEFILNFMLNCPNTDEKTIAEYYTIKKKGVNSYLTNENGLDYLTDFITRLYVNAFFNDKCRSILVNVNKDFPDLTEGILGEMYYSWAVIYNIYAKQNNKRQIPYI